MVMLGNTLLNLSDLKLGIAVLQADTILICCFDSQL